MIKSKKTRSRSKKAQRKYAQCLSLYPVNPEDALSAFMKVNPKKVMAAKARAKRRHE